MHTATTMMMIKSFVQSKISPYNINAYINWLSDNMMIKASCILQVFASVAFNHDLFANKRKRDAMLGD